MPIGHPAKISAFYDNIPHRGYGCWEWAASKNDKGYGQLKYNGEKWLAHRFSWTHVNGHIPSGLCVLHKCDNPGCVNPKHLFLGSNTDNVADKVRKRRQAACKGETNGRSKLTPSQVTSIRKDQRPSRAIARDYGIRHISVLRIKRRQAWGHLS